jgi:hypothetical protein
MSGVELPIPDFDHLPLGDLITRIRSLDPGQLQTLLDFESAHGARVPVLEVLNARREELARGVTPTSGDPAGLDPQRPPAPAGGSAVSPATTGPKINPPSQGDPTNPAQPRT